MFKTFACLVCVRQNTLRRRSSVVNESHVLHVSTRRKMLARFEEERRRDTRRVSHLSMPRRRPGIALISRLCRKRTGHVVRVRAM